MRVSSEGGTENLGCSGPTSFQRDNTFQVKNRRNFFRQVKWTWETILSLACWMGWGWLSRQWREFVFPLDQMPCQEILRSATSLYETQPQHAIEILLCKVCSAAEGQQGEAKRGICLRPFLSERNMFWLLSLEKKCSERKQLLLFVFSRQRLCPCCMFITWLYFRFFFL